MKNFFSTKFLLSTALITTSVTPLVACESAEFSGGRRRQGAQAPAVNQRADGPKATDASQSKDPKVDEAADTNRRFDPKPEPQPEKPGEYTHDPITSDIKEGGWTNTVATPQLKTIFDTDRGGGSPDAPSEGGGNYTPETDNNKPPGFDTGTPGQDGVPAWSEGEQGVFWVPCNPESAASSGQGSITGKAGAIVRVAGEFCPQRKLERLNVLFIVDFSGSMAGPVEGPNDPLVGNTCGRLRAAEALAAKFSQYRDTVLQLGMVGFSNDAGVRMPFTDLASFKASLSPNNWCGADSSLARTNYRAAFESATLALNGLQGDKVVYFISDGSPTVGGSLGVSDGEAGLRAALTMRQTYPHDLVLNAVFLGYTNGQAQNPRGYLETLTGNPDAVRLVNNADELVKAVTGFAVDKDLIEAKDVSGKVEVDGQSQSAGLANFRRRPAAEHSYVYLSEPIALKGQAGETKVHVTTFTAKTKDGKTLTSKATINYVVTE